MVFLLAADQVVVLVLGCLLYIKPPVLAYLVKVLQGELVWHTPAVQLLVQVVGVVLLRLVLL
jgi:hypothetical protein